MVTSIVFAIQLTSAIEFELISPESANAEESFLVSISSQDSENHDVKIFIQDLNKKIISQIFEGSWKNPHYYIKSAFPDNKEFKIRAITNQGNYEICARLRKTGKTSFDEKCNSIAINPPLNPDSDLKELKVDESSVSKKKSTSKKPEEKSEENSEEITPQINNNKNNSEYNQLLNKFQNISALEPIQKKQEKIILNSKPSLEEQQVIITNYEKHKTIILYSFIGLLVIIIIFLSLKKL